MSRSFVLTFPAIALAQQELEGCDGNKLLTTACKCGGDRCGATNYCFRHTGPKGVVHERCGAFLECDEGEWMRCYLGMCGCLKKEGGPGGFQKLATPKCSEPAFLKRVNSVREYLHRWINHGVEAYKAHCGDDEQKFPLNECKITCDPEKYHQTVGVAGRLTCQANGKVEQNWDGYEHMPLKCEKKCEFIENKKDCLAGHRYNKCSYDEGAKTCQRACSSFHSDEECPSDRCKVKEEGMCVFCDTLISKTECQHAQCQWEEWDDEGYCIHTNSRAYTDGQFDLMTEKCQGNYGGLEQHPQNDCEAHDHCFWKTHEKCVDN